MTIEAATERHLLDMRCSTKCCASCASWRIYPGSESITAYDMSVCLIRSIPDKDYKSVWTNSHLVCEHWQPSKYYIDPDTLGASQ